MMWFWGLIYTVFSRVGRVYIEIQTLRYSCPLEGMPLGSESRYKDSKLLHLSPKMAILPHCVYEPGKSAKVPRMQRRPGTSVEWCSAIVDVPWSDPSHPDHHGEHLIHEERTSDPQKEAPSSKALGQKNKEVRVPEGRPWQTLHPPQALPRFSSWIWKYSSQQVLGNDHMALLWPTAFLEHAPKISLKSESEPKYEGSVGLWRLHIQGLSGEITQAGPQQSSIRLRIKLEIQAVEWGLILYPVHLKGCFYTGIIPFYLLTLKYYNFRS